MFIIYLTMNMDTSITHSDSIFTANHYPANYQWINCDSSYSIISNETNQSFIPTFNGNFAVIIDNGICIDTSSCYSYSSNYVYEKDLSNQLLIYPNPSKGQFTIKGTKFISFQIINSKGQEIYAQKLNSEKGYIDLSKTPKGIYLIKAFSNDAVITKKIVIK